MWASAEGNITAVDSSTNNSSRKLVPSSYTSKSSSSTTCSPSSSLLLLPSPTRQTMEEVWKDISLSSLHEIRPITREILDDPGPPKTNSATFRDIMLQDFLARPFNHPSSSSSSNPHIHNPLFGSSSASSSSSSLTPPTTALSLNSGPEFPNLDALPTLHNTPSNNSSDNHRFHCFPNAASISFSFMPDTPKTSFDALASSPPSSSLGNKKRMPESEENSGDRRHKRMIKNRESAARSRARKQAWS